MSRHLLCEKCYQKYLPAGKKTIPATRTDPPEHLRLTVGIARKPKQDQRYMIINDDRIDLDLDAYECDFCSQSIVPGAKCAGLSIWLDEQKETDIWEYDYLDSTVDGLNRTSIQ